MNAAICWPTVRALHFRSRMCLHPEPYLVIANLDDGGEWARIFLAAPIDAAEVESTFGVQCREVEFVMWDNQAHAVRARKQRLLGALVLRDQPSVNPDPEQVSRPCSKASGKPALSGLPWTKDLLQWRARVQFLRRVEGSASSWPDVSTPALLDTLEQWLSRSSPESHVWITRTASTWPGRYRRC